MFYFVIFIQTAINTGVGVGAILLAGECLEVIYLLLYKEIIKTTPMKATAYNYVYLCYYI